VFHGAAYAKIGKGRTGLICDRVLGGIRPGLSEGRHRTGEDPRQYQTNCDPHSARIGAISHCIPPSLNKPQNATLRRARNTSALLWFKET